MCLSNRKVPVFSPSRSLLWLQLSEQVWTFICSRVLAQPRFYAVYEVLSLFGFPFFSQCRPRKLSVGLSRPMRSGTKENFTTKERVCTFSSNFTRQIVTCVPTVPHITGHSQEGKKSKYFKIRDRVKKKKSCIDFLSLCNVSHYHGSPPPYPLPDTLPHSWQQQTKRADFSGLRRGRPAFDLSPLRRKKVWGHSGPEEHTVR